MKAMSVRTVAAVGGAAMVALIGLGVGLSASNDSRSFAFPVDQTVTLADGSSAALLGTLQVDAAVPVPDPVTTTVMTTVTVTEPPPTTTEPPPTTTETPPTTTEPPPGGTAPWRGSFGASYQAAPAGSTIIVPSGTYGNQPIGARSDLRNGTCSLADTSECVQFVTAGPVQINGSIEAHGAGILIDGGNQLRVTGYVDTEADSTAAFPDHVVFKNLQTGNIGAFSSHDVAFVNVDVGPSTQTSGCPRMENKIGYNAGIVVEPTNILFDGVYIHNQNVDASARASGCHYGGLFVVTVDGLIVRNSTFERNVVYHVQIQNFSGPRGKNVVFDNNRFGCPVEWLNVGDVCDGQRAIQFDYDPGTEFTLSNNVAANGPNGLYGCYVGTCGGLVGVKDINNVNLPASTAAPG